MKLKLLFLLSFTIWTHVFAMEVPSRKRKAADISTLSEQEQIDIAQQATKNLINLLEDIDPPIAPAMEAQIVAQIKQLLEQGANSNAKNDAGEPILFLAIETGSLAIAQLILDYGAHPDIKDDEGESALIDAVALSNLPLVNMLLAAGANPNIQNMQRRGNTPLIFAIRGDQKTFIRALLQAGADPSLINNNGESAITLLTHKINNAKTTTSRNHYMQIKNWIEHPDTLPKKGFVKLTSQKLKELGLDW